MPLFLQPLLGHAGKQLCLRRAILDPVAVKDVLKLNIIPGNNFQRT